MLTTLSTIFDFIVLLVTLIGGVVGGVYFGTRSAKKKARSEVEKEHELQRLQTEVSAQERVDSARSRMRDSVVAGGLREDDGHRRD